MKNPKNILILGLAALTSVSALAGEKAGNGGVVFLCPDRVKLVDFWEAEDLGNNMSLGNKTDELSSLSAEYLRRVKFFDEARAASYSEIVNVILEDLKMLDLDPSYESKLVRFTSGPLGFSLDSDEINGPLNCEKAQAVTQKEPEIDGEKLLTIYRPIWNQMDNEMRVLTIFHEINIMKMLDRNRQVTRVARYYDTVKRANPYPKVKENSTRPARLLNQFFGSPKLSGKKTICEYAKSLVSFRMMELVRGFEYGGFTLGAFGKNTLGENVCDPTTRLITYAPLATKTMKLSSLRAKDGQSLTQLTLRLQKPNFDPNAKRWTDAELAGESSIKGRATQGVDGRILVTTETKE